MEKNIGVYEIAFFKRLEETIYAVSYTHLTLPTNSLV